ncbi:MAG: hypothetical protein OHK0037_04880 [Elainellaceae cyanobacterium]
MNMKQTSIRNQWIKLLGLGVVTVTVAYTYPGVASMDEVTPSATTTEAVSETVAGETVTDAPSTGEPVTGAEAPVDTPAADVTTQPTAASAGTLTQLVSEGDSFNTLETALKAAGLDSALSEAGPFTVFAPTDEAFEALPAETLEALLRPENQRVLQQILAYHVVSGSVTSDAIQPGDVATVEGNSVAIAQEGETVTVSGARVVQADIVASNGVIHAIDQVLIPPGLNLQ